ARQYLSDSKLEMKKSVQALLGQFGVPKLDADRANLDLEYWYFGSFAAFQQGDEIWRSWNGGLRMALPRTQITTGDDCGSWDPVGCNARIRGRVGQTALCALCLEIYYPAARMETKR